MPIQEISWRLGYSSTSAFIAMFNRALGCSPQRYRLQSAGRVRMTWRAAAADANIVMLCKQLGYATVQIAGYRYQHKKQQDICLSSQLKRKWHKHFSIWQIDV